jgi:hypothetical protein
MPMENYSKYQQQIIRGYYKNRDSLALQRAQELVTELYLSEGKKRAKVWEQLAGHLAALKVPEAQIASLREKDKTELVAQFLQTKL